MVYANRRTLCRTHAGCRAAVEYSSVDGQKGLTTGHLHTQLDPSTSKLTKFRFILCWIHDLVPNQKHLVLLFKYSVVRVPCINYYYSDNSYFKMQCSVRILIIPGIYAPCLIKAGGYTHANISHFIYLLLCHW